MSKRRFLTVLIFLTGVLCYTSCYSQTFVFASLEGAPINTSGWSLGGNARIGNIKSNDNSEIVLCDTHINETGSVFFNQPINLAKCNKWKAEFDFRMFDGTAADGIAFCFLDVPPSNFVSGQGVGIPSTSNGLKVVFDTYNNCVDNHSLNVPKIELRWGTGYDECSPLPTIDNSSGNLSFIRSDAYNHAVITYDAGDITVTVNNQVYLTGFQTFNFAGYLGFTSGTGGNFDNQSIKNVIIYTNVPSFDAGNATSICAGQTTQIGSLPNAAYRYQWSPADGLNSTTIANPTVSIPNDTKDDISRTYTVVTSLSDSSGCTATDSVQITVLSLYPPAVSITPSVDRICDNNPAVTFTATTVAGGRSPLYQWQINGNAVGNSRDTFSTSSLSNGDVVSCILTNNQSCALVHNAVSNAIQLPVYASPTVDAGPSVSIDYGQEAQLNAVTSGDISRVEWNPASGLDNDLIINPLASPKTSTLYTIRVQSPDDCITSDTVTVRVISKDVVVPTAFTPNGDGKNEIFKPIVLGTTILYKFQVYNQWGQMMFGSDKAGAGWDGTYNGKAQGAGTYTWMVSCTLDTHVHIMKQGTVVLIR